ncbi:serine/threonine protein kinase, partial [Cellulomonas sp. 179-A 9B4 NHS]
PRPRTAAATVIGAPTRPTSTGPGTRSRRHRAVVGAAAALLVLGGGAALVQGVRPAAPPEPPTYPAVDGALGDALVELQRSVEP